jgi:hypothetical protein
MGVETNGVGEWLGLKDAAAQLGLSDKTVRKRAKSGVYPCRTVTTPFGDRYEVLVDGATTPSPTSPTVTTPPATSPDAAALVALADELRADLMATQAELVQKAEAAAMWQARAEMLVGELADARGTILALQAPQDPPATAAHAEEAPDAPQPGRWRRVLRWLGAEA